jgi:hypothetical protein
MSSKSPGRGKDFPSKLPAHVLVMQIHLKNLNKRGARLTALPKLHSRSGLCMLGASEVPRSSESDQVRLHRLKLTICATEDTWMQWRGVEKMRLCEAIALHHHLDPAALGMSSPNFERYHVLRRNYFGLPESPIPWFNEDLNIVCQMVLAGHIACVELNNPIGHSIVRIDEILEFMGRDSVYDFAPDSGLDDMHSSSTPSIARPSYLTVAVQSAAALWRTVAEGGAYVPGDRDTFPDVDAYLRREHEAVSQTATFSRSGENNSCSIFREPHSSSSRLIDVSLA